MKKILVLATSLLLNACGNSGSGGSDGGGSSSGDSDSGGSGNTDGQHFSMEMQSMNLCGQTSPTSNYEVIAYTDDGGIISRHQANNSGQVQATFDQSHVNLAIVRDKGADTSDKKNLDITVLAKYPVGDLGTLTLRTGDTDGCQCQTTTVYVIPGGLSSEKLNLPYSGFTVSTDESRFDNTQLCKVEEGVEALLVANHLDNDSGFIYYSTIADPSQYIIEPMEAIPVFPRDVGQVGRAITVNTTDQASHQINYVTDQIYDYSVPDKSDGSINVLDHQRVEKIEFHAYSVLDLVTPSRPVRVWGGHVPLTDDTTDISYSKPEFEPELLSALLDDPTSAYNLDGDAHRVLTGYIELLRPDHTIDEWHYILPSRSNDGLYFELPADYLEALPEGSQYQDLATITHFWDLNEIPVLNSLDEFYQSDWLKVLLPIKSPVRIRPPAAYSYVSLEFWSY